jgi:hypothetical protein
MEFYYNTRNKQTHFPIENYTYLIHMTFLFLEDSVQYYPSIYAFVFKVVPLHQVPLYRKEAIYSIYNMCSARNTFVL